MPDQNTPGFAGQGGEAAPATGGDKGGVDYERAYGELRPEYTRTTQELAQYRDRLSEFEGLFEALHDSDPEVQAAAMEALGLEPADAGSQGPTGTEEWVDPLEKEVEDLRRWRAEVEAAREQEASERSNQELEALRDDYIGEAVSLIEESLSTNGKPFKFSEREEEVLGNLSIAMPDQDGLPDVRAAYSALYGDQGLLEVNRERWIDTKEGAPQAPLGTTIPADRKPRTRADRVAWADERWAQIERQQ